MYHPARPTGRPPPFVLSCIYDNQKRDGDWYYWLQPGDAFDLQARRKIASASSPPGVSTPR